MGIVDRLAELRRGNREYSVVYQNDGYYVNATPAEGPRGPYTNIVPYERPLWMRGEIPKIKRYNSAYGNHGAILEFSDKEVAQRLTTISDLANHGDPDNESDRIIYQQTIMPVFESVAKATKDAFETDENRSGSKSIWETGNYAIFPPLHGGEFTAAAFLYNMSRLGIRIPFTNIACFELKRLRMEDGSMFLGYREGYMPPINKYTARLVVDDCAALHMSASRSIEIANDGHKDGFFVKRPVVVVAAASQWSMSELSKDHNAATITGGLVLSLDDHGYLRRTAEEGGGFFVGDMGRWLGRLPDKYDDLAPWNRLRKVLVDFWHKKKFWPTQTPVTKQ